MIRPALWLASTSLLLLCCDGGGGASPPIPSNVLRVRGSAGGDYRVAARETFGHELWALLAGSRAQALGGTDVDNLVAIPVGPSGPELHRLVRMPLGVDGAFSVDLDRSTTWLLLLTNEDAIPEERVVAYVTLGAGSESMLAFPVPEAAKPEVDLGMLHRDGPDAESTTPPDTSFELSAAALLALARTDDAYRNVVNAYMNREGDVAYEVLPTFGVEARVAGTSVAPAEWGSPSFGPYVRTNDARVDVASLCAGTTTLTFHPPASVTTSLRTFGPDMPLSTAGGTSVGGGDCIGPHINFGASAGLVQLAMGAGPEAGVIPFPAATPGVWRVRLDGVEVARFDLAITDPIVAGHWVAPVPSVSLTPDAGGVVSAVEVRWHEWSDASAAYVPLADTSGLARNVTQMFIDVRGSTSSGAVELVSRMRGDAIFDGAVALTTAWSTTPGATLRIESLAVGYTIASTTLRFVWTIP